MLRFCFLLLFISSLIHSMSLNKLSKRRKYRHYEDRNEANFKLPFIMANDYFMTEKFKQKIKNEDEFENHFTESPTTPGLESKTRKWFDKDDVEVKIDLKRIGNHKNLPLCPHWTKCLVDGGSVTPTTMFKNTTESGDLSKTSINRNV
uniref:Uncharacterized protein n=1 Tax=Clastoptera arizonana TaxID=38151 RepID=A0A1B6DKY8_9HEMI